MREDLIERLNEAWRKLYGDGDEHGVCDTLAEAAAALAQQPAAEPRSTHRVWRRNDWLPCYCEATSDHHIGCEQPEAQAGGAVAIPADSVDGELSVEQAINELCEMHPGADRLAMKLLAALFTHKSVIRYRADTTPPAKVPEGPPYKAVAELMAWVPGRWENGTQFTEEQARQALKRAMLAAAPAPKEGV